MSKRKYRGVLVKEVNIGKLVSGWTCERVVFGIDVAKHDFYSAVMDETRRVRVTVKWKHPRDSREFLALVKELGTHGLRCEVAMEPSGVYGDALREKLLEAGHCVFRVSPKRCHDAAEVYDGVPSWHDAKSAAIVGKLHLDGASERWALRSDHERRLTAALHMLEIYEKEFARNRNRLEALLARYWPELPQYLNLDSATLLELLKARGGPGGVVSDREGTRELIRRVSRGFLEAEKINLVLESATSTLGMPQIEEERRLVMKVSEEARRCQRAARKERRRIEKLAQQEGASREMAPVIGKTTAAVMVAAVGDPTTYKSAKAYLKSTGLNLKEKSSGKRKGALHITKRGPGIARMFLYLAVLRLIQSDPVSRAWYAKKVRRQGGKYKSKAIVAIMRKLVLALWYVARGDTFDTTKLFDIRRLNLDRPPLDDQRDGDSCEPPTR